MTEFELVPTAIVAGGAALARGGDGRVVFVEAALPGERVRVRITEERKDFARAVVVDVLEASADRVEPPCPTLAAGCGGCTWQYVAPDAQVRLKGEIVADALRRIGRLAEPPPLTLTPPSGQALRTTARLAVTADGRAGHRARHEPLAVETDACLAAHPLLEELIVGGRYPGAGEALLRVGVASGERMAQVRMGAANVRVPAGVVVVEQGDGREAYVHEDVAGRTFRVSAGSFFQSGPAAAEGLVAAVSEAVGDSLPNGGHLVDAYAGVGLFASTLGSMHPDARVTAIESDRSAVADARLNLADLDARVVASEVGRWRPTGRKAKATDVVVADPARSGLGRPGVATIAALEPTRLVLVNCDPASLGRDVALLAAAGYRLTSIAMVDAFPHTFHVETVSRFDRG